jgi:hypothetical protein
LITNARAEAATTRRDARRLQIGAITEWNNAIDTQAFTPWTAWG